MSRNQSWTNEQLVGAVIESTSYRMVIIKLSLVPAGGNYEQVQRRIKELQLSTDHFKGKGWSKDLKVSTNPGAPLESLLMLDSKVQSFLLKKKLYKAGIKKPECELCGWAVVSPDGRIPVELDHINGNHYDNRLENLRILCPNCHSLQLTHRGRNKKVRLRNFTN